MSASQAWTHTQPVCGMRTEQAKKNLACEGSTGKPELPCAGTGNPQRAEGTGREHATYVIPFESCNVNTGDFLWDVKGSGNR
jgi:hypothetical protein